MNVLLVQVRKIWNVHFNWSGGNVSSFFIQVSLLSDGAACHLVREFRKYLWFISWKIASEQLSSTFYGAIILSFLDFIFSS